MFVLNKDYADLLIKGVKIIVVKPNSYKLCHDIQHVVA